MISKNVGGAVLTFTTCDIPPNITRLLQSNWQASPGDKDQGHKSALATAVLGFPLFHEALHTVVNADVTLPLQIFEEHAAARFMA